MMIFQRIVKFQASGRLGKMGRSHRARGFETLESRELLSAAIVGSPSVYASIQAAVDAATPGATIKVTAGTYDELVTVNKKLTILGAQSGVDARSPGRGVSESVVQGYDFGNGNRTSAFYVTANDVTIDGFTVQNQRSSKQGAGIVLAPSIAGTHITDNIVRSNVAGLYLSNNSATDAAVIQHNVFASNNNPGDNNGRGIYTDGGVSGGTLTNVLIDANTFTGNVGDGTSGNPEAAIGLEAGAASTQTNITITNNVINANGKALLVYDASGVTFSNNQITGSTDTLSAAVRLEGNVSRMTIDHNVIQGGSGAAVRISDKLAVGPNSDVTVNFNAFAGNAAGVIVESGGYIGTLDARYNYWGSSTGPSGAGMGTGQSVSDGVLFSPWLTEAPSQPVPTPHHHKHEIPPGQAKKQARAKARRHHAHHKAHHAPAAASVTAKALHKKHKHHKHHA